MMGVARGPVTPVAGTDNLGYLLAFFDDKKRYAEKLAELKASEAAANAAWAKVTKAKDIDKALKNADAREAKSAEMLDDAMVEAVTIRDKAKAWVLAQEARLSDMETNLAVREKQMVSDANLARKMAGDKMHDAKSREAAANTREAEAAQALKMAEDREIAATAANEKWAAALTKAREVQAALGA